MSIRAFLLLALTSCAAACSPTSATIAPVSDTGCVSFHKLSLSEAAINAMDDRDLEQVEAHNCTGARICGWPMKGRCPG